MANKSIVQKKFNAGNLTAPQRVVLAKLIIAEIQSRTESGIDANGKAFPGYSKEYFKSRDFKIAGKSGAVNLELTGEMMNAIDLISEGEGFVVIGFNTSDEVADRAEGNILGSYGGAPNSRNARNFLGLPDKVLRRLLVEAGDVQEGPLVESAIVEPQEADTIEVAQGTAREEDPQNFLKKFFNNILNRISSGEQ